MTTINTIAKLLIVNVIVVLVIPWEVTVANDDVTGAAEAISFTAGDLTSVYETLRSRAETDYLIQSKDVLKIVVYDEPDMSTSEIRVSIDGFINLPLIGKVAAKGLNSSQIEEKIESLLKDDYIINPQVSILLQAYGRRIIYILGAVGAPGSYTLDEEKTLIEMITAAGGLSSVAGDQIVIKRVVDGVKTDIAIDRVRLFEEGDLSLNIGLLRNDFVYVPTSEVYYVLGEVGQPGSFVYNEDITVFHALLKAGGVSEVAARKRIRIVRGGGKTGEIIVVNYDDFTKRGDLAKDIKLLPEDIIIVPQSFF